MIKKVVLWVFAAVLAVISLASIPVWLLPRNMTFEQSGGIELVYALDPKSLRGAPPSDLAPRSMEVLQRRVDPNGVKMIVWRVVDGSHIQIQMPLADRGARTAREEFNKAQESLQLQTLKADDINHILQLQGKDRDKAIDALVPPSPSDPRNDLLRKLAQANDALVKAAGAQTAAEKEHGVGNAPVELLATKREARNAFDRAQADLMDTNVDVGKLNNLLSAADDPLHYKDAPAQLAAFPGEYPVHKPAIERVIAAHKKLMALGGGGDDLEDLQRLIAAAGVLDFRITVNAMDLGDPDALAAAISNLQRDGPIKAIPIPATGTQARWFEIDPNGLDNFGSGFITARWGGKPYVLCFDDIDHALAHNRPNFWTVSAHDPFNGQDGIELPFNLDPAFGARYMEALTRGNVHRQMAILLDDRAMSAPMINGAIRDAGIISFGRSRSAATVLKEANDIKQVMDAGLLPAVVLPQPVSVREIAPIANARPFPWLALWTFGPLPVLALVLLALILAYRKLPSSPPAQSGLP